MIHVAAPSGSLSRCVKWPCRDYRAMLLVMPVFAVAVAGSLGALCRYAVGVAVGVQLPW